MSADRTARIAPAALALGVFCLALSLVPALPAAAQSRQVMNVSNATELLKAIGPNRVIQLKKGEYLLSSAYGVKSKYVEWIDADDGKELSLSDLSGMTIKGVAGSRIVVDSPSAYYLDLQNSSQVSFENLVFVRKVEEDAEISAGGIYVENSTDVSLARLSFEGPSGYPLELSDSSGVTIQGCRLSSGQYGAIYAGSCSDVSVEDTEISDNEGYPLISLEECSYWDFSNCRVTGNYGMTLMEIYAESGEAESITFTGCDFSGNEFDYFAGPGPLPETIDCAFDSNSFGEDWMDVAVAPEQDYEYYGDYEAEYATWSFGESGLETTYPTWWYAEEGDVATQATFQDDTGEVFVAFMDLPSKVPANPGAAQMKKLFTDAGKAFVALIKKQATITLTFSDTQEPSADDMGLYSAYYSGEASSEDGQVMSFILRIALAQGKLYAMIGLASDEALLEPGSDASSIIDSLSYVPQ